MKPGSNKKGQKKYSALVDLKPFIIFAGIILLLVTLFLTIHLKLWEKNLVPYTILCLIAGLCYEGKRLTDMWQTFFLILLTSYILSFISFAPGKYEYEYQLENHIKIWSYYFIFIFTIISIGFHKDKIIPNLTEGITFIQTMAIIYWIIDYGFVNYNSFIVKILIAIGTLFSIFSLLNAFTTINLSRTHKLVLSIWSSVIMMLFSVDNVYSVYHNDALNPALTITDKLYFGLQYFVLGICTIYMAQNLIMVIGFLPGKTTFFNSEYFENIRELAKDHISRYSDIQIKLSETLICLALTILVFSLNYVFKIIPRNTAIWIVFVIVPFIINRYNYYRNQKIAIT